MVRDFADKETERVWKGERSRKLPPDIQEQGRRKLRWLHRALTLDDLRSPPGYRFKPLKGDHEGEYSVRINDQWRIYFRWSNGEAYDVRIGDDHR